MEKQIKLSIEYTQDSDCMQQDNLGQNLTIRNESDGVGDDSYIIIETDRWAIDNIEEFIDILTDFKKRHDLIKNEIKEETKRITPRNFDSTTKGFDSITKKLPH